MSKTRQGSWEPHPLPAHQPVSGLFFLCSFLLLIGIPASGYVEIWAKACLNGVSPGVSMLESDGMTMQRRHHFVPDAKKPGYFPKAYSTGKGMAVAPDMQQ